VGQPILAAAAFQPASLLVREVSAWQQQHAFRSRARSRQRRLQPGLAAPRRQPMGESMELKSSAEVEKLKELRKIIDAIPTLTWRILPDGSHEFHNQRWQDFTGLSAEQSHGSGWTVAIHPDDAGRLSLHAGGAGEVEARVRRFDRT
jgi:PAS domain-containing protein